MKDDEMIFLHCKNNQEVKNGLQAFSKELHEKILISHTN